MLQLFALHPPAATFRVMLVQDGSTFDALPFYDMQWGVLPPLNPEPKLNWHVP